MMRKFTMGMLLAGVLLGTVALPGTALADGSGGATPSAGIADSVLGPTQGMVNLCGSRVGAVDDSKAAGCANG